MESRFKFGGRGRSLPLVLSLGVMFSLVSCSSAPSESLAVDFINKIGAHNNLFKVKSLKKTNGMGEGNQYIMEYDLELECLTSNTGNRFFIPELAGQIRCSGKGEVHRKNGWLQFEKTENGWQVNSLMGRGTWRTRRGSLDIPY